MTKSEAIQKANEALKVAGLSPEMEVLEDAVAEIGNYWMIPVNPRDYASTRDPLLFRYGIGSLAVSVNGRAVYRLGTITFASAI